MHVLAKIGLLGAVALLIASPLIIAVAQASWERL